MIVGDVQSHQLYIRDCSISASHHSKPRLKKVTVATAMRSSNAVRLTRAKRPRLSESAGKRRFYLLARFVFIYLLSTV